MDGELSGQLAREALKASRARYQELFHLSPVPLWEEDVSALMAYLDALKRRGVQDLRAYFAERPDELRQCARKVVVLDVNQAALDLHHAGSKEELLGQLDKIFTPRSYETFLEEVVALAEGAQFFEKDAAEVSTLDGETRFLSIHVRLRPDRQSVLLATPDITRRVLAEQGLRESEERLRAVIEQLSDGVSLTDEQGRVIVWNSRLESITGLPADAMLGRPIWDVQFEFLPANQQTPERHAQLEESLRAFLKTGQAPWADKLMERSFTRQDGEIVFVEEITFAIQTRRDFMLGSVIRDITGRMRTAEELQRYREHLEELVAERTTELEQRNEELRRFALLAADRELRMKELREEIKALREQLRGMDSA